MTEINEHDLFANAFRHAAIGMALVGLDGHFLKVNNSLCRLVKYNEAELTQLTFQDITHPDDLDRDLSLLNQLLLGEIDSYKMEKRYYAKDSSLIWILLSVSLIKNVDATPKYFISQIQDITALKEANKKLIFLAHTDILTGIPNRYAFQQALKQNIKGYNIDGGSFSLLYIDFDNFKRLNDTFGHSFGDNFLKTTAAKFQSLLTDDEFIARLNGDEFIIILKNDPKQNKSKALAIRLLQLFHQPFLVDNQQIQTNISIGIAHYPEHGATLESLMQHADYALYELKRRGGNNYMFFNANLAKRHQHGLYIEKALLKVAHKNIIRLNYQPVIHLETLDVFYYEALARWHDEKLGNIQPDEFIFHAEKTGMIDQLGTELMRQIFMDINYIRSKHFRVGINLSPLQLMNHTFAEDLHSLMMSHTISKDQIILEFIETALISESSDAMHTICKLSEMGIETAIDDFGTGYASMNYIRQFDINAIKIDKTYIKDIEKNINSYEIVKAIITLGQTLNIKVIAEGIENQQQLSTLKELGCQYGQGFFFAKPMPIDKLHLR